jgi:hypothetical protein
MQINYLKLSPKCCDLSYPHFSLNVKIGKEFGTQCYLRESEACETIRHHLDSLASDLSSHPELEITLLRVSEGTSVVLARLTYSSTRTC